MRVLVEMDFEDKAAETTWDLFKSLRYLIEDNLELESDGVSVVVHGIKPASDSLVKDLLTRLKEIDKEWWFKPGPGTGVCCCCEGGADYYRPDRHSTACIVQQVHSLCEDIRHEGHEAVKAQAAEI